MTSFSALSVHATTLSGATGFNADASGNYNHGGITATSVCCQIINIEQGTFTGNSANYVTLPISLVDGDYTFYLEASDWTSGFGVVNGGINLFLDGSSLPGISVFGLTTTDKTVFNPTQVGTTSTVTASLTNSDVNGSGTMVYTSGGTTVTLKDMQWVGASANAYSTSLTVQRIDLNVSSGSGVPEPATFLLMGAGFGVLGLIRRKLAW